MLNDLLPQLQDRVGNWAEQLKQDQWINEKEIKHLLDFDTRTPANLFKHEERPLVVGFFGGTGVGKSSLLNRLAGESIARTGVERPTSREITLYLHQSLSVDSLPDAFPTDSVKIALHKKKKNRDIMWIDMPDFDSAEQSNQELVLQWLPYIDVLIYVVNPERYKDDKGWRLLLKHGLNHAWLFVINHWDRGVEEQFSDFKQLLVKAGLENPVILRTDSNPDQKSKVADDFQDLESTIQSLANENIIKHLQARGIDLRIQALQKRIGKITKKIGSVENIDHIANDWQSIWQQTCLDIKLSQQWSIVQLSERFASTETRWISSAINSLRGKERKQDDELQPRNIVNYQDLWSEQVKNLANDSLERLVQNAKLKDKAVGPLKKGLHQLRKEHEPLFARNLQDCLHNALKTPGSRWHRLFHRMTGMATTLLPVAAMLWVAYEVIIGFYYGTLEGREYLGINFAIHGFLLIGLAWLVPYYTYQRSKPSLRDAAHTGMQNATDKTLREFNEQVLEFLEQLKKRQEKAVHSSQNLFSEDLLPDYYSSKNKAEIFSRILMHKKPLTAV